MTNLQRNENMRILAMYMGHSDDRASNGWLESYLPSQNNQSINKKPTIVFKLKILIMQKMYLTGHVFVDIHNVEALS